MWNTVEQSAKKVCLEAPFWGPPNFCRPFSRARAGFPGRLGRFWRRAERRCLEAKSGVFRGGFRRASRRGKDGRRERKRPAGEGGSGASGRPKRPISPSKPPPEGENRPPRGRRGRSSEGVSARNIAIIATEAPFLRVLAMPVSARRSGREAPSPLYRGESVQGRSRIRRGRILNSPWTISDSS